MSKWVRIEAGVVQEIVTYNPAGEGEDSAGFPPEIVWVEVPTLYEDWVSSDWSSDGTAVFASVPALFREAKERAAAKRWSMQTRGIIVNGNRFLSDQSNLGLINDAVTGGTIYEQMSGVPGSFVANWKSETGIVPLTIAQLVGVGMFGLVHTQNCFNREGEIVAAMETASNMATGDIAKTEAIITTFNAEVDENWPTNSDGSTVNEPSI